MKSNIINDKMCPICFTTLDDKTNFCPACGEPISSLAKDLIREQKINTELSLLSKIVDLIKDERDLKMIKSLTDKLSEL